MAVYIARFGLLGPVKIGISHNVLVRLGQISARLWDDMHVLRVLEGGEATERMLHKRFEPQRIRLEWFHYHPDMVGGLGIADLADNQRAHITPLGEFFKKHRECRLISDGIRNWMIDNGLNEVQLASLLGVKPATVSAWLSMGYGPHFKPKRKLIEISNGALAPLFDEIAEIRAAERLPRKQREPA